MDNSEGPDILSHNVLTWNTQQPSFSLDVDDSLWPTPVDIRTRQHHISPESNFSFLPDANWVGLPLSHVPQFTWSSEMPRRLTPQTLNFNQEPTQSTLETTVSQDWGILPNSIQCNNSVLQANIPKRGPKAATMTDQRWKPAEHRIRHLWVTEKNGINKIRNTVNKEFGFNATERQYKDKIKKMGLQRNSTTEERKKILRQVHYRKERLGKESKYVRLRGHMLSEAKLDRWWKEQGLVKSLAVVRSPSPLPTEISIRTSCRLNSPTYAQGVLYNNSMPETHNSIVFRLLDAAQHPNQVIDSQQARSLFNDIQQLLETRNNPVTDRNGHKWRPELEPDLVNIRNLMNLHSKVMISPGLNSLVPANSDNLSCENSDRPTRRDMKFSTWYTQYGRLGLSFWTTGPRSAGDIRTGMTNQLASNSCARIDLFTESATGSLAYISLDFNQACSIPFKLYYQAMVPNDSNIWKIVEAGDVEALREAFVMQTASLTDRDEDGRSLLGYAVQYARPSMCKFLLEYGADPDAIELDSIGDIGPIFQNSLRPDLYADEKDLKDMTQCRKLMLEYDIDLSQEAFLGDDTWISSYNRALAYFNHASFEYVLVSEKLLMDWGTKVCWDTNSGETSSLFLLADNCRYPSEVEFEIIQKALLLLRFGADITRLDEERKNILHRILESDADDRFKGKETLAKTLMMTICNCDRCNARFQEPRQFLEAAISKGANIYTIDGYGDTPTMTAKEDGRDKEWQDALEACGIDVNEVKLHTEAWEIVLDELEGDYSDFSIGERAKLVEDFSSNFWDSRHPRQESSLSFEEFCKRRDLLRFPTVNCGPEDYGDNIIHMLSHLSAGEEACDPSQCAWIEEQNQKQEKNFEKFLQNLVEVVLSHLEKAEILEQLSQNLVERVLSHLEGARVLQEIPRHVVERLVWLVCGELKSQLRAELSVPDEAFNYEMESQNHDGILSMSDNLALPTGSGVVADAGSFDDNNRDVDMTNTYWEDPFYIGPSGVGTPVMGFGEFMDLDITEAYSGELSNLGASHGGEPLVEMDEL